MMPGIRSMRVNLGLGRSRIIGWCLRRVRVANELRFDFEVLERDAVVKIDNVVVVPAAWVEHCIGLCWK